jgi:hypothetical protein
MFLNNANARARALHATEYQPAERSSLPKGILISPRHIHPPPLPFLSRVLTDRGTLTTGEEFDSSYKRGKPATFAPNQVIKGWTEAMQLMKEGDKWELYIPSVRCLSYSFTFASSVCSPASFSSWVRSKKVALPLQARPL